MHSKSYFRLLIHHPALFAWIHVQHWLSTHHPNGAHLVGQLLHTKLSHIFEYVNILFLFL